MKNKRLLQEVNSVLQHVSTALNSDRNSFFLFNEKLMTLETVVAQGVDDITLSVPISKGIVGATFTKGKAIIENQVQNSPIFYSFYDTLLNYTTESTICVPVFDKNLRIIGVLQSLNKKNGYFQDKDITILKGFAATISLIVKNIKLIQKNEHSKNYPSISHDATMKKQVRLNLSRYIPLHLVNDVIDQKDLSILQSKNRKCSILFSDIRNFTKLTEELGANQIVNLLNKYFDAMVNSIHEHNGILDKFIGDAVMGVFGVPYTNTSDSINAVKCALDMLNTLKKLNSTKSLGADLKIGIGISTGNVISGNIGSEKRFEYTVIGNPVNLAARLENETKKYGYEILVCENTYKSISPHFICKEIDSVKLKGKRNEIKIYAVLGNS